MTFYIYLTFIFYILSVFSLTDGAGPMYFVGPWGRCNGEGYRHRTVYCRIFIEVAKTAARLPDSQCTGDFYIDTDFAAWTV